MEVAVCVSRYDCIAFYECELYFRFTVNDELFALVALLCFECYPFDEVFFAHRMVYGTYRYRNDVAFLTDNGKVFFY